jgi:hypothetical protein
MFRVFKVFIVFWVVLLCSFSLNFQSGETIKIIYFIDGVEQNICKNSRLFFINKLDTIEGKLDSLNYLGLPPDINSRKFYDIVFLHKKDTLTFKEIDSRVLTPDQKYEWSFGIDNRPFDNLLGILPYEEYLKDTITRKLTYWQFRPLEKGDGVFFYNKIRN